MQRLKNLMIYQDGGKIWNNLDKTQRRDYIYNSFVKKGYNPIQAAAIVGNLQRENDTFGTTRKNEEGSGATGIAQWLGSRKKQLISDYKDWHDIDNQIDFIHREIQGDRNAWTNNVGGQKAFFNAKDVETATHVFRKDFERPGESEANDKARIKNAYAVLGKEQNYQPYVSTDNSRYNDMAPANYSNMQSNMNLQSLNGFDFNTLPEELKQTVVTNQRLQQEKELQEIEATKVQQENLAIQQALENKKQERESMLAMLPVAEFVPSGNMQKSNYNQLLSQPQEFMQKGGWIPFSQRTPKTEKIRTFYNDMISSNWYKQRLSNNGYDSKLNPSNWFSDGAQDEVDYRSRRVQHTRVNKIDMSKNPFSTEENQRYKDLEKAGTHWMPKTNEINYKLNDKMMDEYNVDPDSNIAHEFGHPESAGRLNDYEYNLLESNLSNRTKDDHDRDPNESKADINALRYNLYKQGLFDPKSGKYKTKTGKFESSLLKNVRTDFITERLLQNYDTKNLEFLVNTIAQNNTSQNEDVYMQQGGKVNTDGINNVLSILNPKNWFKEDYSDSKSYGEAYNRARTDGEKEFLYKGKRYNTTYNGTPNQQLRETGIIDNVNNNKENGLDKRIKSNVYNGGYYSNYSIKDIVKVLEKPKTKSKDDMTIGNYQVEKDLLDLYLKTPVKGKTLGVSKYKPTQAKDKNTQYYSINTFSSTLNDEVEDLNSYAKELNSKEGSQTFNVGLGDYTVTKGKDNRGNYISYYDVWDINPFGQGKNSPDLSMGVGKSFEIYDRIYYKDYGDGKQRKMFFDDKELKSLDPNKKEFNTLELQKELKNRGYKFEKSMKGNVLDGIYGDETKKALVDWQNKNKK